MKKLFIISALAIAASFSLYSCNNGPYDVNPGQDNSAALNPEDPNSGVNVYLRTMEARINGIEVIFKPVYYNIDTNNVRRIFARSYQDSLFFRTLVITYPENTYLGVDSYNIGFEPGVSFYYSYFDTGAKKFKEYHVNTGQTNKDGILFTVAGEEGGHMRGVLQGTLYRTHPDIDMGDEVRIDAEYYAEKRPFPNPF